MWAKEETDLDEALCEFLNAANDEWHVESSAKLERLCQAYTAWYNWMLARRSTAQRRAERAQ